MQKVVESVTAGQPDKMCDQIADAIVDEYIRRDPKSRIDLNVMGSNGMLMIGGQVNAKADFDIGALAQKVYLKIGYQDQIEVFVNVDDQTEEMKNAGNGSHDLVSVSGYATAQTRELMPRSVVYAHQIARTLDNLRRANPSFDWLRPDGKVQLVMEGDRIVAVTVLASHHVTVTTKHVREQLLKEMIEPLVQEDGVQIFINPIGEFTECGFRADSGATGRKLNVDTYGGLIPCGDGAMSGKDPMKAERCGAYMARHAARYLVKKGLCSAAMVNIAYTLGRSEPVLVQATGMGMKSRGSKMDLTNVIKQEFDFRPEAIVERLNLQQPLYELAALYGHFGREEFPWEQLSVPVEATGMVQPALEGV